MLKQNSETRIRLLSGLILVFAVLLLTKLYFLQIVHGEDFANRADRQYVRSPQFTFNRGTVYFQSKDGSLISAATVKTGYLVAINPKTLQNKEDAYTKISSIIPIDYADFMMRASKQNDTYEEIAKKIDESKGKAIEALKIPGVHIYQDKWRLYPGGQLAAHVLGFVGYKGDELAGRYGLERSYESVLSRSKDSMYVNFFAELFTNIKTIATNEPLEGDIVTTIEPAVQSLLEQKVKEVNQRWSSETTGGLIINPKTGEIYSMALYPTFDPNAFQQEKSSAVFSNFMVEGVREMGSIIKPLTIAAGLDSKAVTPTTVYHDTGCITLNTQKICNYDGKARGDVDMQEVLNHSLNLGVSFVVKRMGNEKFTEYMKNFGFGEKTGIDLPNEASGLIKNLDTPRDLEHANASFGQGIALTPLETVRALATLGNGGKLITPHIVKEIKYKVGYSKNVEPKEGKRVISEESSKQISAMLVKVVDNALLNGKAKNLHYSVAAKTGTAQIAIPGGGGYYKDRYLHSFFGYFPAYDPKFLVFMYTIHPKGVQYASETLTQPFLDISKFLINYYEIPPDR
jgi:stage V sporulation protein D (sporulation-specific penicillin-binding protein)